MRQLQKNGMLLDVSRVKWQASDLPQIIGIAQQIKFGSMSQREAARRYNVTRYEVDKWISMVSLSGEEGGVVDDEIRSKVIRAVYYKGMTQGEASETFKVNKSLIRIWIAQMNSASKKVREGIVKDVKRITSEEQRRKIVRQIQLGEISKSQAVRRYQVSRHQINEWVHSYSEFNLEEMEENPIYYSMKPEEQNEQLKAQIRQLEKELEYARLKTQSLEVLIQVAEEKFGIKIKKKSGPGPQK